MKNRNRRVCFLRTVDHYDWLLSMWTTGPYVRIFVRCVTFPNFIFFIKYGIDRYYCTLTIYDWYRTGTNKKWFIW